MEPVVVCISNIQHAVCCLERDSGPTSRTTSGSLCLLTRATLLGRLAEFVVLGGGSGLCSRQSECRRPTMKTTPRLISSSLTRRSFASYPECVVGVGLPAPPRKRMQMEGHTREGEVAANRVAEQSVETKQFRFGLRTRCHPIVSPYLRNQPMGFRSRSKSSSATALPPTTWPPQLIFHLRPYHARQQLP